MSASPPLTPTHTQQDDPFCPPAPGKGVKRPRPSQFTEEEDEAVPSLEAFQSEYDLSDHEMIKLCSAYAAYLRAVHRKKR